MKNSLKFIQFAVDQGVLQFGEFTLKSGRVSPYFLNTGLFNDGRALERLGAFYARAIVDANVEFDMLFGPAYKGIPLAAVTAVSLAREHALNVPYAFNRKEAKEYGDGGQTVGTPIAGRVLIVDDVITAGTAINETVKTIRGTGGRAAGAVIAFDRQERGATGVRSAVDSLREHFSMPIIAVATVTELVQYIEAERLYDEHLPALRRYLREYKGE